MPFALLLVVVDAPRLTFLAKRTTFGRHVYAVGGNAEAARRAGINVPRIRILVFMISGFMAGLGGIVLAVRLTSVDLNAGGGTLLIDAIAAAVIGGTSLFGGRGEVRNALIGAALIATISNGMNTLGYDERDHLHRHRLDPAPRGHVRHDRAPDPGQIRALAVGCEHDPVGRDAVRAASSCPPGSAPSARRPSSRCRARSGRAGPRGEVARAGVHLLDEPAPVRERRR